MLSQLLGRIHRNKARIQLMVDPWVAPSSCLGQHLNFKGLYILNGEVKVRRLKNQRLSSLALDELIDNLKVHEVVMEKDSEIYRGKMERIKSIALKAKKESSDDETSTSESDDEEYAMVVCLRTCLEPDEWITDSGCSKHMTGNKSLFSTYKAYDGEHVDNCEDRLELI
ncbi:hypothetical protein Tco_1524082 [Tanacetum coccineum]